MMHGQKNIKLYISIFNFLYSNQIFNEIMNFTPWQ